MASSRSQSRMGARPEGEGKLRNVLMVDAKLIDFVGNFTCGCPRRLVT